MASQGSSFLSRRAVATQLPALPYFEAFIGAQNDLWSPENPAGHIVCTVAENRLSCDVVHQGLTKYAADLPTNALHYNDMRGIPELREALAGFLQATFMKGVDVDPTHLSVLSGAGAVIELLYHCIADEGSGVLIPAPYYPAFDNDLKVRNQVATVPVYLDPEKQDYSAALDAAAAAAAAGGHPIAALMFTHPDNPTGRLYSRAQIQSMVRWCLLHKVHCVSDEIYANSVFADSASFFSTAHILQDDVPGMEESQHAEDLIHIIFGFSKDFCASGLRIGCLYSRSQALNNALNNVSYFASTPANLQWSLSRLLCDEVWLQHFLAENKRRMKQAYTALTSACDAAGVPYRPAEGAMFLWIDLRAALTPSSSSSSSASWDAEHELWKLLVNKYKVILTPGSSCHAAEPGFFRICWAWPHPDSLPQAIQRIATAVDEFKATMAASNCNIAVVDSNTADDSNTAASSSSSSSCCCCKNAIKTAVELK